MRGAGTKSFASGADISEFEEVRGNAKAAQRRTTSTWPAAEHAVEGHHQTDYRDGARLLHRRRLWHRARVRSAIRRRTIPLRRSPPPSSALFTAWNRPSGSSTSSGRPGRSGSCSPASTYTQMMRLRAGPDRRACARRRTRETDLRIRPTRHDARTVQRAIRQTDRRSRPSRPDRRRRHHHETSATPPSTPRTTPKACVPSSRSATRGSPGHDHHRSTDDDRPGRRGTARRGRRRAGVRPLLPHPLPRPRRSPTTTRTKAARSHCLSRRICATPRGVDPWRRAVDRARHLDGPRLPEIPVRRNHDRHGDPLPPCRAHRRGMHRPHPARRQAHRSPGVATARRPWTSRRHRPPVRGSETKPRNTTSPLNEEKHRCESRQSSPWWPHSPPSS